MVPGGGLVGGSTVYYLIIVCLFTYMTFGLKVLNISP